MAAILVALLISRLLLNPIRRVREGTRAVAHEKLPEAVARIRAGEDPGRIVPIDVMTDEEVGQLARAVDDMHRQAVLLASGEAKLRSQVSEMFVTLSRRNTSLINQQLGLIETHPGRGTYVRSSALAGVHRPVGLAIRRRGVTVAQLSEARIALESEAAGLAAERATAADIERLESALRELEAAQGIAHVQRDLAFHLAIAAAAHNPVIEMMLESIAPLTVGLMTRSVGDPKVMRRSQPYHGICLEAIRRHEIAALAL